MLKPMHGFHIFWKSSSRSRRAVVPAACYATPMNSKPPYYRIYLLTVWQEQNRGPPERIIWRFRLEDPRTGRQQLCADATTLLTALEEFVLASQGVDGMTTNTNGAEGAAL